MSSSSSSSNKSSEIDIDPQLYNSNQNSELNNLDKKEIITVKTIQTDDVNNQYVNSETSKKSSSSDNENIQEYHFNDSSLSKNDSIIENAVQNMEHDVEKNVEQIENFKENKSSSDRKLSSSSSSTTSRISKSSIKIKLTTLDDQIVQNTNLSTSSQSSTSKNNEELKQNKNLLHENTETKTSEINDEFQVEIIKIPTSKFTCKTAMIFFLLLAPLIMGFHISALSNGDDVIKYFSVKLGYSNKSDTDQVKIDNFPKLLWSLGCLYPIGGMIGALSANSLINNLGRKKSTLLFLLCVKIGGFLKFMSINYNFFLLPAGRLFDGIGSAGIMVTAIVLMFELLCDAHSRWAKPMVQILINTGILCISSLLIPEVSGKYYHYTYLIPIFLSIPLIFVIMFLPESPVFIYSKYKDSEQTYQALQQIHGKHANLYLERIKNSNSENSNSYQKNLKISELFKNKRYILATISCIVLNSAQQLSGINAVMAFSRDLLKDMNLDRPDLLSLGITSAGLFGSILFAPIVSGFKRKISLLIGHSIMAICLAAIIIIAKYFKDLYLAQVILFSIFVFIFQIGPGPLVWFICMEVFTSDAIASAQSIGVASNWISNAIPYQSAGINILFLFVTINIIASLYIAAVVEETLNKNSQDVLDTYENRYNKLKGF